ncbi:MAG: hypothetical protein ACK58L_05885 [Planctomycetota bacterium]
MTGIGLLMQGWAYIYAFVSVLGMLGISFLAAIASGGSGERPMALAVLAGLVALGNLVAGLVILIGQFLCLAVPGRSGAKGWVIGAIASLFLMIVLFMSIGMSVSAIPLQPGFGTSAGRSSLEAFANIMVWVWLLCVLAYLVCNELFLRQAALYIGREDLARQALIILIGVPSVTVVQFVATLMLGLLVPIVGPGVGFMLLAMSLVALVAYVVFAVMHVALLLRLGSAMRE